MKTTKQFVLLLSITCLAFLLQNCGKIDCDNEDKVTEYKLDSDAQSKIPYKGFETLTFVRTTVGDTHTFVSNGWKQLWGLTSTQDDCPQKERYERRDLTFTSPTFPKSIVVSIYRHEGTKTTFLEIRFQNTKFYTGAGSIREPYDVDSINVLGTVFNKVEILSDLNSATPETFKCYYNQQFGILRIFFENGETWDLLKQ